MDYTYRKAEASDAQRIAELFEEMLRTIYQTPDIKGYEDGYLDKFFSGGDDVIYVAEREKELEERRVLALRLRHLADDPVQHQHGRVVVVGAERKRGQEDDEKQERIPEPSVPAYER